MSLLNILVSLPNHYFANSETNVFMYSNSHPSQVQESLRHIHTKRKLEQKQKTQVKKNIKD